MIGSNRAAEASSSTVSAACVLRRLTRSASLRLSATVAAACSTASQPSIARCTASRSVASPTITSVGSVANGRKVRAIRSGRRTNSLTSWPSRKSAAAVCDPTKPVPPVTRTFTYASRTPWWHRPAVAPNACDHGSRPTGHDHGHGAISRRGAHGPGMQASPTVVAAWAMRWGSLRRSL